MSFASLSFASLSPDIILVIIDYLSLCDANALRIALYPEFGVLPNTQREVVYYTHLIGYYECLEKRHSTCLGRYHRFGKKGAWKYVERVPHTMVHGVYYATKQNLIERPPLHSLFWDAAFLEDIDMLKKITNEEYVSAAGGEIMVMIPKNATVDLVREIARILFSKPYTKQPKNLQKLLQKFVYELICRGLDLAAVMVCKDFKRPKQFIAKEYCLSMRVHRGRKFITYTDLVTCGKFDHDRLKDVTLDDLKVIESLRNDAVKANAPEGQLRTIDGIISVTKVRLNINEGATGYAMHTAALYDNVEHATLCIQQSTLEDMRTSEMSRALFVGMIAGSRNIFSMYDSTVYSILSDIVSMQVMVSVVSRIRWKVQPYFTEILKKIGCVPHFTIYDIIDNWDMDVILPLMDIVMLREMTYKNAKRALRKGCFDEVMVKAKLPKIENARIIAMLESYPELQDKYTDFENVNAVVAYVVSNRHTHRGITAAEKYAHMLTEVKDDIVRRYGLSFMTNTRGLDALSTMHINYRVMDEHAE